MLHIDVCAEFGAQVLKFKIVEVCLRHYLKLRVGHQLKLRVGAEVLDRW